MITIYRANVIAIADCYVATYFSHQQAGIACDPETLEASCYRLASEAGIADAAIEAGIAEGRRMLAQWLA